ncbi:MAG: hypothetical protein JWR59_266 [Brevundimonas sp.]|nr:hypothetical protein [Brevundimonas sp.]
MRVCVVAAAVLSLVLSACVALPPQSALPPDISQAVQQSLDGMEDGVAPARLATRVSITPSGDDWMIDYQKTGDFNWCGTGGCTRELYVARDGGHRLAFREQVIGWRLTPGSPVVLDIDIHGANCAADGARPCLRRYIWNEAEGRLDEAVNREGFGYLVGPLFQPVPIDEDLYPSVVMAEIARRNDFCHAAGGLVDAGEYSAVSSPDLNGDGQRDWIVGSKYTDCSSATGQTEGMPRMGLSVITSGQDGLTVALRVDNTAYAIDITQPLARFGLRDESACLGRPTCPTRYFVWDPSREVLAEGETDWIPDAIPTAETWLECSVVTTRQLASTPRSRVDSPQARAGRASQAAVLNQLIADYELRMTNSLPRLSAADEVDRRRIFTERYDDPDELEAAQWRADACVVWLQDPA